jgi:adenine phosphoribosyltransferase
VGRAEAEEEGRLIGRPSKAGALSTAELRALVRTVPDFPASGIQFRDITTLIADGPGLAATIDHLVALAQDTAPVAVAGIEARGFLFGAAIAARLGVGFIPLRKAGKLPVPALSIDYALEYGSATLELDPGAVQPGKPVVLVDDLIATGGTAMAGVELLRQAGAEVSEALFVIDLPELGGAAALRAAGVRSQSLMEFAGH